jgi:hypothetical protein
MDSVGASRYINVDYPGWLNAIKERLRSLTEGSMTELNPAVARVLKRLHFPLDVILTCVRWYVAYPLSMRHLEENDGSARRFGRSRPEGSPLGGFDCAPLGYQAAAGIGESVRRRKRPVGKSWRMDETYIRVKGEWRYLHRAVDKDCNTMTFCYAPIRARLQPGVTLRNRWPGMAYPRR